MEYVLDTDVSLRICGQAEIQVAAIQKWHVKPRRGQHLKYWSNASFSSRPSGWTIIILVGYLVYNGENADERLFGGGNDSKVLVFNCVCN